MSVQRFTSPDAAGASSACAQHILRLVEKTLTVQDRVSLAVSGGSTPKLMFGQMVNIPFPWDRVHLFFVDERCVPPTDDASNFKLADDHLIRAAHIPADHIHRVQGELVPGVAASKYAAEIQEFFRLHDGEMPHFDIIHRGVGPDAHTASLFPGDPLIADHQGIAAATFAAKFNQWRVTLLPGVLEAARHTVFLVAGADKVDALRAVFHEKRDPQKYPAQIATDGEDVAWFLDEKAAAGLE